MAKGTGLIGNFKGKVGNAVGYKLSASNNGQTQGIRVYQPIVKNPKTAAQAEQRAKLSPINATYRALKMVIDRGNEGLPYGNKSRLAWLKGAFKAEVMPWFEKGAAVTAPVCCPLTKGSLSFAYRITEANDDVRIVVDYLASATDNTIGKVSEKILAVYPELKEGDQLTFVSVMDDNSFLYSQVSSFVINTTSTDAVPSEFSVEDGALVQAMYSGVAVAGAIILSREGANGEHLRSTTSLALMEDYPTAVLADAAKTAAIASYQASAASNSDWAEESIQ